MLASVFMLQGLWKGGLLCSCTGCNAGEMVDWAGVMATRCKQGEEGAHLEMAPEKRCRLGVCYVSPHPHPSSRPPFADGLLIKQKLDTGSNYCIASPSGLIQGLVLSVSWGQSNTWVQGDKDGKGQLCNVTSSHCSWLKRLNSRSTEDSFTFSDSVVIMVPRWRTPSWLVFMLNISKSTKLFVNYFVQTAMVPH